MELFNRRLVTARSSNIFGNCPLYTVSIVLQVNKHNSLPLGQIRTFISRKLLRSPVTLMKYFAVLVPASKGTKRYQDQTFFSFQPEWRLPNLLPLFCFAASKYLHTRYWIHIQAWKDIFSKLKQKQNRCDGWKGRHWLTKLKCQETRMNSGGVVVAQLLPTPERDPRFRLSHQQFYLVFTIKCIDRRK